jgi:hypothetical protein
VVQGGARGNHGFPAAVVVARDNQDRHHIILATAFMIRELNQFKGFDLR